MYKSNIKVTNIISFGAMILLEFVYHFLTGSVTDHSK